MEKIFDLFFGEFRRLGEGTRVIVEGLGHRAELAAIELAEARSVLAASAVLLAVSVGLLLLAGATLTVALAAAVWNTPYRIPILALIGIVYAVGAMAFLFAARRRLRRWEPFGEISAQLRKDARCLAEIAENH
jgi:uncharacterized membrane protein YqjE